MARLQASFNPTIITEPGEAFDKALALLSANSFLSVDTETTGVDPLVDDVLLLSIGSPLNQYVFDLARVESQLPRIKALLENPKVTCVLHNAKFDYKFLKHKLGIEMDNLLDTMLAEMLLQKGRKMQGFGLDDVTDKYLGVTLNKEIRKTFTTMRYGDRFSDEQLKYSAMDVMYLELIRRMQLQLFTKHGLTKVGALEMSAIPPSGDMELNGMFLNRAVWLKAENQAIIDREAYKKELDKFFIETVGEDIFGHANINYESPKQLLPILKKIIGKAAQDLKSTGEDAIKDIPHPVVRALLDYREQQKRVSTYGSSFLNNIHPKTGRIHSDFSQLYTDTGRYSSKDPNMQNIPAVEAYRSAFTGTTEDDRIIGQDYSGMELRILGDLSMEPSWLDCFARGGDLHSENGSILYGKTIRQKGTLGPDDPGENTELRRPVKTLNFGVGYGMGPKKLAMATGMEYEKAKELIKSYWSNFTHVKKYFDTYVQECMDAKCARSPYDGRLRWLEGFDYDSHKDLARIRNMCMNFPMQSGNASITKRALVLIRQHLRDKKAKIVCTVHDEILAECHKDIAEEVFDIVKTDMINAAQEYIKNVKVGVEGKIATCWKK